MRRAEIRVARIPQQLRRPRGVALLAVSGVLGALMLALLAVALLALKLARGVPAPLLATEIVGATLLPLLIVWLYWGLWELVPSAWWTQIVLAPVAALGLLFVAPRLPELITPLIGRGLPLELAALVGRLVIGLALLFAALQFAAVGYLPGVRRAFGVGVPRAPWERRR